MGSLAGGLNEVVIDEKDKKEKVARRLFQLQDSKDPITSVYQHTASQGQRLVLTATTNRLYVFSGKGSLEAIFAKYTSPGNAQSPPAGAPVSGIIPPQPLKTPAPPPPHLPNPAPFPSQPCPLPLALSPRPFIGLRQQ